jgi:transcriptional regulator with XRE-family HTH domain
MSRRRPERRWQYESAAYRELVERVAVNVLRRRERGGWTQEALAERCEMSLRHVQAVEGAEMNLTLVTLARLAEGLGIDVRELFRPARTTRSHR